MNLENNGIQDKKTPFVSTVKKVVEEYAKSFTQIGRKIKILISVTLKMVLRWP